MPYISHPEEALEPEELDTDPEHFMPVHLVALVNDAPDCTNQEDPDTEPLFFDPVDPDGEEQEPAAIFIGPSCPEMDEGRHGRQDLEKSKDPKNPKVSGAPDDSSSEEEESDGLSPAWLNEFDWVQIMEPHASYSHFWAMWNASKFKKGQYVRGDDLRDVFTVRLKPGYRTHTEPTYTERRADLYAIPVYDWQSLATLSVEDRDLAAVIFLCGQVRLGSEQCERCKREQFPLETEDGTFLVGPIFPFCVTAGPYEHGICASCFALGGDYSDMLERCSVSKEAVGDEYERLGDDEHPVPIGGSLFIGNSDQEHFAVKLLFKLGEGDSSADPR
ncbi:hypothetical protein VTK26DRAFT_4653 [Humicola hyalothermophila]